MNRRKLIHSMATMLLAGCAISTARAVAEPGWQEQRLLEPSMSQLHAEGLGRVVIYDGLHERLVDRALDTQFGRMQNMMFIGTRHTDPDGGEWADDDCD